MQSQDNPKNANRNLTTEEAAAILGVKPSTLRNWRCGRSDGPPFERLGRAIRYPLDDLQRWRERRRYRSTSDAEAKAELDKSA